MERITYQRTLDVHKNGIQFTLQGIETGDNLSRVIELSLMASGDAIDFPLENVLPIMYVRTPGSTEPSIIECTIKDNVVVYEILPISDEGITEMQLKLIETRPYGAKSVLIAPKFALEVTKSSVDDSNIENTSSFTAFENAIAKAKAVYDQRFLRMELSADCIFRAYYADGTMYETDILKTLFHTGSSVLAESFAKGGTGVRTDEDIDNAMYYSNVAKSASIDADNAQQNSKELLAEARLHGLYTTFTVDFDTGEVEYVSPSYKFDLNEDTGHLEATGKAYTFEKDIVQLVIDWLDENGVDISNLQKISGEHTQGIAQLKDATEALDARVTPVSKGGTGAETAEDARINLGAAHTFARTVEALNTEWVLENEMYKQTIACEGLLATDTPFVDVCTNDSLYDNTLFMEAWGHIIRAVANDGSIDLYTDGTMPKTTFSVNVKVVR